MIEILNTITIPDSFRVMGLVWAIISFTKDRAQPYGAMSVGLLHLIVAELMEMNQ